MTERSVIDDALGEMTETEEDLADFQISQKFRTEFERIRLDIGLSPYVIISDEVIKMVLLANNRSRST